MHTAAAFRAGGFEVRQSSHYVDPESGKGREIDVVALHPDVLRTTTDSMHSASFLTRHAKQSPLESTSSSNGVVNSPILQCVLTDEGEIEVTEVTEGEWLFAAKIPIFSSWKRVK